MHRVDDNNNIAICILYPARGRGVTVCLGTLCICIQYAYYLSVLRSSLTMDPSPDKFMSLACLYPEYTLLFITSRLAQIEK